MTELARRDTLSGHEIEERLGLYAKTWDNLSSVLEELDAVGYVPGQPDESGKVTAHASSEFVLENLGNVLRNPHLAAHSNMAQFRTIHRMLEHLYHTLAENRRLVREKQLWRTPSNVTESLNWVAANPPAVSNAPGPLSLSTIATIKAPYSGVNFMIRTMTMVAETVPPGFFTQLTFAGINFATPSTNVSYVTAGGTAVVPPAQGMGFSQFMSNLTGPDHRVWHPWTGLVFSSDAQIYVQWFNADPQNTRSLIVDYGMISSPCQEYQTQGGKTFWHEEEAGGYHALVDAMYGAVVGLRSGVKPAGVNSDANLFQGMHTQHLQSGGFPIHRTSTFGGLPHAGHTGHNSITSMR